VLPASRGRKEREGAGGIPDVDGGGEPVALPAKVVAARKERGVKGGGGGVNNERTSDCGLSFCRLFLTAHLLLLLC
jgi:hypothetical protein